MPLRPDIFEQSYPALSIGETVDLLVSDLEKGLNEPEAAERKRRFGANVLQKPRVANWVVTVFGQFKSPLILLLLVAAVVTTFIADYQDALFILAAVVVNAGLGFYQEHKADTALAELTTYLRHRARVIRDGTERELDAQELVPGDLIRLAQGDRVPADARIVFVNELQTDESMLTGEALPVVKDTTPTAPATELGDQRSMVFAGTLVTEGAGTALVCGTGAHTELGRIAQLVGSTRDEETPLQRAIQVFSVRAGLALGALSVVIFVIGVVSGVPLVTMFITAVAVAVSAVPEGLPIAMTVILAIGVERMARRKGVVRKLAAAEALGGTDIILTDKTGTLTTARMEIGEVFPEDGMDADDLLSLALTNTSVLVENPGDPPAEWRIDGRVVEASLVRSAAIRGMDSAALRATWPVVDSLPFSSSTKYSVSLLNHKEHQRLVFLGAPDILLTYSEMPDDARKQIQERIEKEAYGGALVLGVATKMLSHDAEPGLGELVPAELIFGGLITLRDPVRPNVRAAIRRVEAAGIRIVLVTGDHRGTAEAVAHAAGLAVPLGSVLDARELRDLSDEALAARLPSLAIVARVSPRDKMRIVQAFQATGKVVAMTGDGVNDAPSIRQADVGIAMGSGTAVARDVADLVLLDDNFDTIAAAVEEGRQIMSNLRKVLVYLLSDSTDELFLIGGALLAGLVIPLTALQILWVNFFSDSFPAVAFAFEKEREAYRPHGGRTRLFDPLMSFLILVIGVVTSASLFALYWFLLDSGYAPDLVRTFIFASFASYTLFSAFALRSLTRSVFSYSPFSNPAMLGGVGIGLVLILLALYVPFLQNVLDTVPLPLSWLGGVLGVAVANILAIEAAKWAFRFFSKRTVRRAVSGG